MRSVDSRRPPVGSRHSSAFSAAAALFIIPALFVWNSTSWLVTLCIAFWVAYLWLYFRLARWRAPTWMIISPKAVRGEKSVARTA